MGKPQAINILSRGNLLWCYTTCTLCKIQLFAMTRQSIVLPFSETFLDARDAFFSVFLVSVEFSETKTKKKKKKKKTLR
eukprot:NODE_6940_length_272_cov_104.524664_g6328_i0.p1 GENE.NODE_6940_length_272_cov_104.524664_g6328_i0~~NODE_6940_length_272_cov_104.524664_g6328_i0.p1  ORF type:complete len:89 (-),score=40.59 NODE_6940_length_272_cov_104.524664_g6328_i0:4-240(-)